MSALIIGVIIFVIGIISVVLYFVFNKKSNNITPLQQSSSQIPAPSVGTPPQYASIQEPPKPGSLESCKQRVSKIKFVQEKPYDINSIVLGHCEDYSEELEKIIINNNPSWKGSLFIGNKQANCLNKLQPLLDSFKAGGIGDNKTILSFKIEECNDYKDKAKTAMLGVNPGFLGTIEYK